MPSFEHSLRKSCARAMGLVDLNPYSKTCGCADRGFWHYQDGKGYAVGSFQVMMLALAFLGADEEPEYTSASKKVLHWWSKEILKLGSLDEYFPAQKSFCATAYTTMAASICYFWNGSKDELVANGLKRSLQGLINDKHRPESANQTVAAMLAFDMAAQSGLKLGKNPFSPKKHSSGLFLSEYGGFDLGYSLKCLDLAVLGLVLLEDENRRKEYAELVELLLTALYQICVNGTFSPIAGSRGNGHLLLGGLSLLKKTSTVAEAIFNELTNEKRFAEMVRPEQADDKYLCFFHLNSLVLGRHYEKSCSLLHKDLISFAHVKAPELKNGEVFSFGEILLFKENNYKVSVSPQVGGALCYENEDGKKVYGGYVFSGAENMESTLGASHGYEVQSLDSGIQVSCPLQSRKVKQKFSLVQGLLSGTILKFCLKLPILGEMVRSYIYKSSLKQDEGRNIGNRVIELNSDNCRAKDVFAKPQQNFFATETWITRDGHATRLHGENKRIFGSFFDKPTETVNLI